MAALPIVVLLGGLAVLRLQGPRRGPARPRRAALAVAVARLRHARRHGRCGRPALGRRLRPLPHRLDHPQRHLPLRPDRREGPLRGHAGQPDAASPATGASSSCSSPSRFGAFFEGAAGFGTPVAVTAAILIGLGFAPARPPRDCRSSPTPRRSPSAPWGRPIVALAGVTGLDIRDLSAMVGRQLPFFSLLIPFWLVWAFCGFTQDAGGLAGPASSPGCRFAVPQFLDLELPRALAGRTSGRRSSRWPRLVVLPANSGSPGASTRWPASAKTSRGRRPRSASVHAPEDVVRRLDALARPEPVRLPVGHSPGQGLPRRPVRRPASRSPGWTGSSSACRPSSPSETAEAAVFTFNWLSFTGTGIFVAALVSAAC
ncbi:MAG: L-lactate permease [Anaerotruncus sp.]|nr:L-lactate permease [Anaerotruncus sp.]